MYGLMPNGEIRKANLKMLFEKARQYETASFKGLFNFVNFIDKLKVSNNDTDSAKLIGENENVIRIMSIHKSKGLEFPVVFLCGTGKKFNLQDLNDNILLHQDIGFGPKYIDCIRRIEYNTLAKTAITYKSQVETISEEMRILYVALTRAKEKLIITGLSKDLQKEFSKKQDLLEMYNTKAISPSILKNYKSYLDWFELLYLNNKDTISELLELNIYVKDELIKKFSNEVGEEQKSTEYIKEDKEKQKNKELEELLNWKYENYDATTIQAKTSVSKIKELENEKMDVILEETNKFEQENMKKPKFLQEELVITNAEVGTLMHLLIQKLNEKEEYSYEKLKSEIQKLIQNEIITSKEAEKINIDKLLVYTKSDLYKSLKTAKEIHKEQPFYINLQASKVYEVDVQEKILVQGVIDLYYIDENDNIILVDYKTDYVKHNEQELIDKYKKQLQIYKLALEEALKK